jgi:4Fe-4S single cluster domain
MTLAEVDRVRAQPQRAVLLYLTDNCPVGCAHCSVSALRRGGHPADQALLDRLVDGLCAAKQISLVGISGGEPFAERRALQAVTGRLAEAGKQLVLYTSGYWGRDDGSAPGWTRAVLARAACVVLSTDSYHAAGIGDERYVAALRAAAGAGAWIAVQVLRDPGQVARAGRLLAAAFGPGWTDVAEIRRTELLRRGRAARALPAGHGAAGRAFGACMLASAPVIRYDGTVTACCNEDVITGHGPASLRHAARSQAELSAVLAALDRDPYLGAISSAGTGTLTMLPRYRELGDQRYENICALCWALLGRGAAADPAVRAIALTAGAR